MDVTGINPEIHCTRACDARVQPKTSVLRYEREPRVMHEWNRDWWVPEGGSGFGTCGTGPLDCEHELDERHLFSL